MCGEPVCWPICFETSFYQFHGRSLNVIQAFFFRHAAKRFFVVSEMFFRPVALIRRLGFGALGGEQPRAASPSGAVSFQSGYGLRNPISRCLQIAKNLCGIQILPLIDCK